MFILPCSKVYSLRLSIKTLPATLLLWVNTCILKVSFLNLVCHWQIFILRLSVLSLLRMGVGPEICNKYQSSFRAQSYPEWTQNLSRQCYIVIWSFTYPWVELNAFLQAVTTKSLINVSFYCLWRTVYPLVSVFVIWTKDQRYSVVCRMYARVEVGIKKKRKTINVVKNVV